MRSPLRFLSVFTPACIALTSIVHTSAEPVVSNDDWFTDIAWIESQGWQLTFNTSVGRTYEVEAWDGFSTNDTGTPIWISVSETVASSTTTAVVDTASPSFSHRFYRVSDITDLDDPGVIALGTPTLSELGWRVSWQSVPGESYSLQYWTTDDLGSVGFPAWTSVATVTATGPESFAYDNTAFDTVQRFYRVIASDGEPGIDTLPPSVSPLSVSRVSANGADALRLSATASDNVSVTSVTFFDGETELGAGTLVDGKWEITFALPARVAYFLAQATDEAGNRGYSPVHRYQAAATNRFAILDTEGNPTGEFAEPAPDGSLPSFEYQPGGRDSLGRSRDLSIRFSEGARIVEIDGREYVEFTDASISFGSESPLQFAGLSGGIQAASVGGGSRSLSKHGVGTARLPLDSLTAADLAEAFGYDPTEGIPVLLFNRFPLRWISGTLEDFGISAPVFALDGIDLPLPGASGEYAGYALDFLSGKPVRLPFHGEFEIPDVTGFGATFRVPRSRPIWLSLCPDGRIALEGRVEVAFANGASFMADLTLDDPVYRLELAANGIQIPSLIRFGDLLGNDFSFCLPGQADDAALDDAEACLARLEGVLRNLNASALASLPFTGSDEGSSSFLPPGFVNEAGGMLGDWAEAGLARVVASADLADLQPLLENALQSTTHDSPLQSVLAKLADLQELDLARIGGGFGSDAGSDALLHDAIDVLTSQALDLLDEPDVFSSLESIPSLARLLSELSMNRESLGTDADALFDQIPDLAERFANTLAGSLGIGTGDNSTLDSLDRAALFDALKSAINIASSLSAASDSNTLPGSLQQTLIELVIRHRAQLEDAFASAADSDDLQGFSIALSEMTALIAIGQHSFLPLDAILESPTPSEFATRFSTLQTMLGQADFSGARSLRHHATFLKRLSEIIDELPEGTSLDQDAYNGLFAQIEPELSAAFASLSSNSDLGELQNLLNVGSLVAALSRDLGLGDTAWETDRLPQLIGRLAQTAAQQEAWSMLHESVASMFDFATDAEDEGDSSLRQKYLELSAELLAASRSVALGLIEQVEAARSFADSVLDFDLRLPGDLRIHHVSGAVGYDRVTREFDGRFAGDVEFPEFGTRLAITEGSLASGGEFSIEAFGQLSFPLEAPIGTASIPESDPLFVSYTAAEGLRISGGAGFALENGMYFNGSISLLDPIYEFSMEAGGLKFDLLDSLSFNIPSLPDIDSISEEGIDLFNDLIETVNGSPAESDDDSITIASLSAAEQSNGPLFPGANASDPLVALEAWANYIAVENLLGNTVDPSQTYDLVNRLIETAGRSLDKQFAEFERAVGELSDASSTSVFATDSTRRAMQIDFGSSEHSYVGQGPAHIDGFLIEQESVWNYVTSDDSSLAWADGSPAVGVSIDLGQSVGTLANFNWDAPTLTTSGLALLEELALVKLPDGQTGFEEPIGFGLLRDAVISSGPTDSPTVLAVRLQGLGPGFFVVYAMSANSPVTPGDNIVFIGATTDEGVAWDRHDVPLNRSFLPDWIETKNYVLGGAGLGDAADDIVLITGPGGQNAATWGRIQGLQIIELEPEILSLSASPTRIDLGHSSLLSWDTQFATSVSINRGVGTVTASGTRRVSPRVTTRYTLTASNPSGAVTDSVLVVVDGPNRQFQNIEQGLARMNATYRKMAEHLEEVASDQILGKDTFIDLDKMQEQLDRNSAIFRELISTNNALAHVSKEVSDKLLKSGLDLAAAYQQLGIADVGNPDEIEIADLSDFAQQMLDNHKARIGLNPETDDLDLAKIGTLSADQSVQAIRDLLDHTTTASLLGSEQDFNSPAIPAHLDNAQEKLLASIGFNTQTGTANLSGKSEQELAQLAKDFLTIDGARVTFDTGSSIPPTAYETVGNALQGKALQTLDTISRGKWKQRHASLNNLLTGNSFRDQNGSAPQHGARIRAEIDNITSQINGQAGSGARLSGDEMEVLELADGFFDEGDVAANYQARLEKALRAIDSMLANEWNERDLKNGIPLLDELAAIERRIRILEPRGVAVTIPDAILPEQLIPKLGERFITAARAAQRQQKPHRVFARVIGNQDGIRPRVRSQSLVHLFDRSRGSRDGSHRRPLQGDRI